MRRMLIAAASLTVLTASPGLAASCKDAKGRFVKCPASAAPAAKGTRCRDAKGHFVKCGSPGAKQA